MPNVYVATGYNKWGITTSNIAANIIKDKILKKIINMKIYLKQREWSQ